MTETSSHPTLAMLQRLGTLREMPTDELKALAQELYLHEARRGTVLLELGATDDCTLYLIEGQTRLTAEDGGVKVIRHTDTSAMAPLARLRPSRYKVVAESAVRYLRIDSKLLDQTTGKVDQGSSLPLETYQVEEEDDLDYLDVENQLTLQIYEDLNTNRLLLPSLPEVAVRIGEAILEDNADARKIGSLIETDPAIALKMVKAANSARFGGVSKVATVAEAVARLGLHNTRTLVVTFALRELFRTKSKRLEKRMQQLWEHSRQIAALTQVLSERVGGFNSHEALLAGLVHDIGALAVIGYARDFPDAAEDPAILESSIQTMRSQLSGMILSTWEMPGELVTAAKEAENWYREHKGPADYADLVVAVQLHESIGGDIDPTLVPAYNRLGLTPDEVDLSIGLLYDAHDEIEETKRMLA